MWYTQGSNQGIALSQHWCLISLIQIILGIRPLHDLSSLPHLPSPSPGSVYCQQSECRVSLYYITCYSQGIKSFIPSENILSSNIKIWELKLAKETNIPPIFGDQCIISNIFILIADKNIYKERIIVNMIGISQVSFACHSKTQQLSVFIPKPLPYSLFEINEWQLKSLCVIEYFSIKLIIQIAKICKEHAQCISITGVIQNIRYNKSNLCPIKNEQKIVARASCCFRFINLFQLHNVKIYRCIEWDLWQTNIKLQCLLGRRMFILLVETQTAWWKYVFGMHMESIYYNLKLRGLASFQQLESPKDSKAPIRACSNALWTQCVYSFERNRANSFRKAS